MSFTEQHQYYSDTFSNLSSAHGSKQSECWHRTENFFITKNPKEQNVTLGQTNYNLATIHT